MVAHAYYPGTWKAKAEGPLTYRPAQAAPQALSEKTNKTNPMKLGTDTPL